MSYGIERVKVLILSVSVESLFKRKKKPMKESIVDYFKKLYYDFKHTVKNIKNDMKNIYSF